MPATAAGPRVARATAAQVFHALSDETRLAVLDMLRGGERCVCDLQAALDAAQSRLSFHLKVLKDAGLVTDRRDGRWSYYALNADRLEEAGAVLGGLATPAPRAGSLELHSLGRATRLAGPAPVKSARANNGKRADRDAKDGCC
jgi:ArsR family transcriptional regulator, arsenate/arsenite/antimonite-responsive transcriptional repressor